MLEPGRFKDYGPNGLQVEGRREVQRLVAVSPRASTFIEAGIVAGADALLVHHGSGAARTAA